MHDFRAKFMIFGIFFLFVNFHCIDFTFQLKVLNYKIMSETDLKNERNVKCSSIFLEPQIVRNIPSLGRFEGRTVQGCSAIWWTWFINRRYVLRAVLCNSDRKRRSRSSVVWIKRFDQRLIDVWLEGWSSYTDESKHWVIHLKS